MIFVCIHPVGTFTAQSLPGVYSLVDGNGKHPQCRDVSWNVLKNPARGTPRMVFMNRETFFPFGMFHEPVFLRTFHETSLHCGCSPFRMDENIHERVSTR
jgi:hypothetical protein